MRWLGPAAALLGIGWYFALCILIGLLGGRWLDTLLGTSPLFILLGMFIGLAAALVGGYRMLMAVLNLSGKQEGPGPQ